MCAEKRIIGYWFNGAFAKYCTVPKHLVHRLPENLSFPAGALSEPLACCVNAVIEKENQALAKEIDDQRNSKILTELKSVYNQRYNEMKSEFS